MKGRPWVVGSLVAAAALLFAARGSTSPPQASAPPGSPKAQITILYDAFGKPSKMRKDWGFAAFIEYAGKRILFDTGNDADIFARNVKASLAPPVYLPAACFIGCPV